MKTLEPLIYYILDEDNNLMSVLVQDWLFWHKLPSTKAQVFLDEINEDVFVSTVFFGAPGVIFETMCFDVNLEIECEQHNTWEEAKEAHNRLVAVAEIRHA